MKAYQRRAILRLALGVGCLVLAATATAAKPATSQAKLTWARARTLIFRPSDLPGFKLTQSGSLDSWGFRNFVVEGEAPTGYGWEQRWKRAASKECPRATSFSAGVVLCNSPRAAETAVRDKLSSIAAGIDWQPRLSTGPAAAADRLFVSPRGDAAYGVYSAIGRAGKLAFYVAIDSTPQSLGANAPELVDRMVRVLLDRYSRMK